MAQKVKSSGLLFINKSFVLKLISTLTLMMTIMGLITTISIVTGETMPVAVKKGDIFTFKVYSDHIKLSINGTNYLTDTYLAAPTDIIQIRVQGIKNVSDNYALLGSNTLINQTEIINETLQRDTFSYVNGWLDIYHYGIFETIALIVLVTQAPQAFTFEYLKPLIKELQDGLPVFTTTNTSYYEEIIANNPPPENQSSGISNQQNDLPPYNLSYVLNKELGIYIMNHDMKIRTNGTLPNDNNTMWSLHAEMRFFLNTSFHRSIVNELNYYQLGNVLVGNASYYFEWSLHISLVEDSETIPQSTTTSQVSTSSFFLITVSSSLGILSAIIIVRRHKRKLAVFKT